MGEQTERASKIADVEKLFESKGRWTQFYITGEGSGDLVVPYYLSAEADDGESDEAFMVSLLQCAVDESDGAVNAMPSGLHNKYECQIGAEYAAVLIAIEQIESDGQFTATTLGDMPTWVWWPIGVAGAAIPVVAYLIWRFY